MPSPTAQHGACPSESGLPRLSSKRPAGARHEALSQANILIEREVHIGKFVKAKLNTVRKLKIKIIRKWAF